MYTALILDDEELARKNLRHLLSQHCGRVSYIHMAATIQEAIALLEQHNVDILFLDISLGTEVAFRIFDQISPDKYAIIFVTAYGQYALPALKASALDYLLKPIDIDDLVAAVEKAGTYIARNNIVSAQLKRQSLDAFITNKETPGMPAKLVIGHETGFNIIEVQKIIFAEADGNYTIFYLEGHKRMISSKQIGYYEEVLVLPLFFRSHKSFIINLKYVSGFSSKEGYTAQMSEGHNVTISRRKLPDFLELCKKL